MARGAPPPPDDASTTARCVHPVVGSWKGRQPWAGAAVPGYTWERLVDKVRLRICAANVECLVNEGAPCVRMTAGHPARLPANRRDLQPY